MKAVIQILFLVISAAVATDKVYSNYKVYEIKPKSDGDLKSLQNLDTLEGDARSLDFLSFHNNLNDVVKLIVKPAEQNFVEHYFDSNNLEYKVSTQNVQE